jgi:opacity protein-like surface antigen
MKPRSIVLACGLAALLSASAASAANQLIVGQLASDPPHEDPAATGRRVEKGRKGVKVRMLWVNELGAPQPGGFPINVAAAQVAVSINGTPLPSACGLNVISPAVGACGFVRSRFGIAGEEDTVKVYYNGDFPAGATVRVTVRDVRAFDGTVQDATNNVVQFLTGNLPARTPVSIGLVFDISGSMGAPTAPPAGTVTRLTALKNAANAFFSIASADAMMGDRLSVSFFSTTASGGTLQPAHDPAQIQSLSTSVGNQVPTAATSIGAGLNQAKDGGLGADANPRKFVLLFSDGQENTNPRTTTPAGVLNVGAPAAPHNPAPYPAAIKVCPITAGQSTAPGWTLQRDIAAAACGGAGNHLHILDGEQNFVQDQFDTFFGQVGSDAFFGDKLEVVTDVSGTVGFTTPKTERFLGNTRDTALNIFLSWSSKQGLERGLQLRLTAPDGTVIDVAPYQVRRGDLRFTALNFPLRQGNAFVDPKGEWKVDVVHLEPGQADASYHLLVIADNETLASEYQAETTDAGTGEPIPLRVKLTEAGAPVSGATVTAELIGPDNGLGDALARAASPSGSPSGNGDVVGSPARAKLLLLLQDPAFAALLANGSRGAVTLTDAGGGVYRGRFDGAAKEGHYQFRIKVRGATAANGDFERSRRLTVFVRPKPDPERTDLLPASSVVQPDGSRIVTLRATPRDRFGSLLGPDYPPFISITSSAGAVTVPLADRLDGSYEVGYQVPAGSNPDITLEVMGQQVIRERLDDLGTGGSRRPRLSLHAGFTSPTGSFGAAVDGSLSLGVDLELPLTSAFSVEGYLGHDRFSAPAGGDDAKVTLLSARGRVRSGGSPLRATAFAGVGPYFADGDTFFGFELGGGLEWWLNSRAAVEAGVAYRNADGGSVEYVAAQVGARFRF